MRHAGPWCGLQTKLVCHSATCDSCASGAPAPTLRRSSAFGAQRACSLGPSRRRTPLWWCYRRPQGSCRATRKRRAMLGVLEQLGPRAGAPAASQAASGLALAEPAEALLPKSRWIPAIQVGVCRAISHVGTGHRPPGSAVVPEPEAFAWPATPAARQWTVVLHGSAVHSSREARELGGAWGYCMALCAARPMPVCPRPRHRAREQQTGPPVEARP